MKKYNLVVPIGGIGKKFQDAGYNIPKQLIKIGDRTLIEWSMLSIDYSECNLIFIVKQDVNNKFGLAKFLVEKFQGNVITFDGESLGAVDTISRALPYIDQSLPLICYTPGNYFGHSYKPSDSDFIDDGLILTFNADNPRYSYSQIQNNKVIKTVEKEVISNLASAGVYCFKNAKLFIDYIDEYIDNCLYSGKEAYICPLYNGLIADEKIIRHKNIYPVHTIGTPQELELFKQKVKNYELLCVDFT